MRWLSRLCLILLCWTLCGCQAQPGPPTAVMRRPDLVDLTEWVPELRLDIRYATADNFTGRPLYRSARAFLQRPAALALRRAQQHLHRQGFGLVIYDAYRPWSVTRALWEAASPAQRQAGFVADPKQGSKHNRGCAIDVGLFDRVSGALVPMPSAYDEFTPRAHPDYAGGDRTAREARDRLRQAMESAGYTVSPVEWWHYDFRGWEDYPVLDIPFEQIAKDPD